MKTNFSLLFYMKKQKNYQSGPAPIYMRITVGGRRSETTTGRECEPERWNAQAGRAKGNKEAIKYFNAYLDDLQAKVYQAHRMLTEADKEITADSLRDRFLGKAEKSRTLIAVFKDHNEKMEALVGAEYSRGTLCRYTTSLSHTAEFLKWKYNLTDIDIRRVDHAFINEYEFYLRSIRKCANNSAVKYIRNFGKIIRICLSNRWITHDPFLGYKSKIKTVDRFFLTAGELQQIIDKDMGNERLNQVRDIFIFCCFTGLAYADVERLQWSDFRDGRLYYTMGKNLKTVHFKVPEKILRILEIYQHDRTKDSTLVFPELKQLKDLDDTFEVQRYIANSICRIDKILTKRIAPKAMIKGNITMHIARHSFGKIAGDTIALATAQKLFRHSNIETTMGYMNNFIHKDEDEALDNVINFGKAMP